MRQVLIRAAFLLRRPLVLSVGLLVAAGGVALVRLPLFGLPGFELSLALSIAIGLLGGIVGGTAAFLERRLIAGRDPRPKNAIRHDSPARATFQTIAAATLLNWLFLVPPLLVATGYALVATECDPFEHVGFVALLPIPSALMAAAAGAFAGFAARRRVTSTLWYLALLIGSAVTTAWPIIDGPQVFAFNHFLGHLPGPLYDEALRVTPALGWFRLQTLLWAGALWLLATVLLKMNDGRLGRLHLRFGPLAVLVALAGCIYALEERAPALGFRMNDGHLTEQLGGIRETPHFLLTYPRGKPKEEVDRLERDAEFHHAELSKLLGPGPAGRIRIYVYRSAEEKQALVGAARTQFAKPWRAELHLNDAPFPHSVLDHELAHIMAAPLGAGPFGVTSRYALLPVMGIIEGAAVAADDPVDELTLHQWALGMRRQKLAPDVRDILGPSGFYKNAPGRAYTLVGSFLRYLADTYGADKLRTLYARGDFESSYGRTLDALASEWEKFLETVPLDEGALNQAFARFRQASLFARPCAREVATLHTRSQELLASDPQGALEGFRRCAELQPEEPGFPLGQATALARLGREGEAQKVLQQLGERVRGQPALEAEVALARADLAADAGRLDAAAPLLQEVLKLETSAAVERTARVKLAAVGGSPSSAAIWGYFRPGFEELKLLRLREALERTPDDANVSYLLGRRLLQLGEAPLALQYLTSALQGNLADPIRREAMRLRPQAAYLAGDCAAVRDLAGQLPDVGEAIRKQVDEWVARCGFEEQAYKAPLVPAGPFR